MSKEAHAFSNTSAYTFISDAITAMSLYRYPFVLTNRLILSATYFASFPGERTSCSDTDSQLPLYFAPEYRNSSVSKTPFPNNPENDTPVFQTNISVLQSLFFLTRNLHKRCDHLFAERKNLIRMFIYIRIFSSVHRHCDHHFFAH